MFWLDFAGGLGYLAFVLIYWRSGGLSGVRFDLLAFRRVIWRSVCFTGVQVGNLAFDILAFIRS
ncbi:hypothetical protein [Sporosarcina cyprini]|uniref:hypothetical protein n=1 Tax=Sporosarcina cyprini TaxID=2910523 RepID=UPI001EDE08D3|nr:hypothetical protein [Sporosarcina cyprini]MCG3087005.1 hypothetical protein [Sporosarcina cyprini]